MQVQVRLLLIKKIFSDTRVASITTFLRHTNIVYNNQITILEVEIIMYYVGTLEGQNYCNSNRIHHRTTTTTSTTRIS